MSWSDWGKSKPEPKKDIDVRDYIGFVDKDEPEPKKDTTWIEEGEIRNLMYDLSVKRLNKQKIFGDKDMDKEEIIIWFKDFISKNQKQFTLDWLRGQKLSFEAVNEVRKK